jgi:lysophospholipase L1-like esterase
MVLALGLLVIAPTATAHAAQRLVGPKKDYLAVGNSLTFGFQPDLDFNDGFVNDFYSNLQAHGVQADANMGCPGETSVTFIHGGCPYPYLRKYPYVEPQLNAAVEYLSAHRGLVSPVTLDIGANDLLPDINAKTCQIDTTKFASDLATVDANLTQVILPQLHAALMVNGVLTGDLVMMNLYDPYQNLCPATLPYVKEANQHLVADMANFGTIVDVYSQFGGDATPNPNICSYTWICSAFKDIHPHDAGYSAITRAFELGTGY